MSAALTDNDIIAIRKAIPQETDAGEKWGSTLAFARALLERAALAQAEAAQPVAEWQARVRPNGSWRRIDSPAGETLLQRVEYLRKFKNSPGGCNVYEVRALYAAPQPAEAAPMTHREAACILAINTAIRRMEDGCKGDAITPLMEAAALFAEAAPFARHHGNGAEAAPKQEALTPEQKIAVEQWLGFGRKSLNGAGHTGYFSPGGWAYETLASALAAQPQQPAPEPVARDTRKPCTCDSAGRGPGRACVVKAGGRLGELWRCAKGAAPQTPAGERL